MTRKATLVAPKSSKAAEDTFETPLDVLAKQVLAQETLPLVPEITPLGHHISERKEARLRELMPRAAFLGGPGIAGIMASEGLPISISAVYKYWRKWRKGLGIRSPLRLRDAPEAISKRIVELHGQGLGLVSASKVLKAEDIVCSPPTILKQLRRLGLEPHPNTNPMTPEKLARIVELYGQRLMIKDIVTTMAREGMTVSPKSIRKQLRHLGLRDVRRLRPLSQVESGLPI